MTRASLLSFPTQTSETRERRDGKIDTLCIETTIVNANRYRCSSKDAHAEDRSPRVTRAINSRYLKRVTLALRVTCYASEIDATSTRFVQRAVASINIKSSTIVFLTPDVSSCFVWSVLASPLDWLTYKRKSRPLWLEQLIFRRFLFLEEEEEEEETFFLRCFDKQSHSSNLYYVNICYKL